MDRREQRVVRAWGGWPCVALLAHDGPLSSLPGWPWIGGRGPFRALGGTDHWLDYDSKGMQVYHPTPSDPRQTIIRIPWTTIQRYGQSLPDNLRDRLRTHRARSNRLGELEAAASCEGGHIWSPRRVPDAVRDVHTAAQRWLWRQEAALLDEAFPLAMDSEPTDLLELLAVTA